VSIVPTVTLREHEVTGFEAATATAAIGGETSLVPAVSFTSRFALVDAALCCAT